MVVPAVMLPVVGSLHGLRVHRPASVAEVLDLMEQYPEAQLVAGATWIMRAPMRAQSLDGSVILLAGVAGLDECAVGDGAEFGAMVTLKRIAVATAGISSLQALHEAVSRAATPGLRRMITIGGSIAATEFHASDVLPALLCLDAEILRDRGLILGVRIPATDRVSCHERLTWRSGNEYSVATVSMSLLPTSGEIRVALGSVEQTPRRWTEVEQELTQGPLTPQRAEEVAKAHLNVLRPIAAPGIPADYRLSVIPTVLARAVGRLA